MAHRAHIFGGEVTRYPKDVPVKPVDSVTLFHLPGWTSPSFHRRRPAAAAFCCTKEINDGLDVHGCSRADRLTDRLTTRTVAGRVAVVGGGGARGALRLAFAGRDGARGAGADLLLRTNEEPAVQAGRGSQRRPAALPARLLAVGDRARDGLLPCPGGVVLAGGDPPVRLRRPALPSPAPVWPLVRSTGALQISGEPAQAPP